MPALSHQVLLPLNSDRGSAGGPSWLLSLPPRAVPAGRVVLAEGPAPPDLLVVRTGLLVCSSTTEDGRRVAVDLLGPGAVFGELALVGPEPDGPGPHPVQPEVRAITPAQILGAPAPVLAAACRADPAVGGWLAESLARRAAGAQAWAAAAASLPVDDRVVLSLRRLAGHAGRAVPGGLQVTVPLTQDLLAELVGATRESVNRALARLRSQSRVRRRGRTYTLSMPDPGTRPSCRAAIP